VVKVHWNPANAWRSYATVVDVHVGKVCEFWLTFFLFYFNHGTEFVSMFCTSEIHRRQFRSRLFPKTIQFLAKSRGSDVETGSGLRAWVHKEFINRMMSSRWRSVSRLSTVQLGNVEVTLNMWFRLMGYKWWSVHMQEVGIFFETTQETDSPEIPTI
jgi:hypothetical protein